MQTHQRLVLLLVLLSASTYSQAQEQSHESVRFSDDHRSQTDRYWSEQAISNALTFPTPVLSPEQLRPLLAIPRTDEPQQLSSAEVEVLGIPARANVNDSPFNKGGKLFFSRAGENYSCSAQFVGSTNILMTAAHCIRDEDGTWSTEVTFRRGFNAGGGQLINSGCMATKNGWVTGGDTRYRWDYAFIQTADASNEGYMGLEIGIPYDQFKAIGYPDNFGNGQYMYQVDGTKGQESGGVVEMRGNPMRSGNSGGAWLAGKNVIGVNSYHLEGNSTEEWSPVLNDETLNLYQYVSNGCSD